MTSTVSALRHAPERAASAAYGRYLESASMCGGRVGMLLAALRAVDPGELVPLPGTGRTDERLRLLARVAEADITAARVLEPHVDAVAILDEVGQTTPERGTTWGVFAAEAPGIQLDAIPAGDGWVLQGRKPWCSLAGELTHGLVTARTFDGERRMFAVDLKMPSVKAEPARWVARGLAEVVSGPIRFDGVPAIAVGEHSWYLERPGFRWGAIGVAACWWGGCLPIFSALTQKTRAKPDDALGAARLGALYRALGAGRLMLRDAAFLIDAGTADRVLAHAVRGTVADAVVATLDAARDVLGPAALAFDESIARRCADLELYVSQYHRGRDDASLAGHLAERPLTW